MKKTYLKAEVFYMTSFFVNNDPQEGEDPDSLQDNGLIETITGKDIDEVRTKLNKMFDLSKFDAYEEQLEASFEEFDYKEQINYVAHYTIFLSKVEETLSNAKDLK